jgi:hypothetical protein
VLGSEDAEHAALVARALALVEVGGIEAHGAGRVDKGTVSGRRPQG